MECDCKKYNWDFKDGNIGAQLACAHDHNELVTEDVCREIFWDPDDSIVTGTGRWHEHKVALFEHEGKYYGIKYDEGLTESQENEYYEQVPRLYERVEVKTYTYKEVE